jgi:hypothetical protein
LAAFDQSWVATTVLGLAALLMLARWLVEYSQAASVAAGAVREAPE